MRKFFLRSAGIITFILVLLTALPMVALAQQAQQGQQQGTVLDAAYHSDGRNMTLDDWREVVRNAPIQDLLATLADLYARRRYDLAQGRTIGRPGGVHTPWLDERIAVILDELRNRGWSVLYERGRITIYLGKRSYTFETHPLAESTGQQREGDRGPHCDK